jgi:hypothetical protein
MKHIRKIIREKPYYKAMKCRDCSFPLKEEKIVCKECEKHCISLEREREEFNLEDVKF